MSSSSPLRPLSQQRMTFEQFVCWAMAAVCKEKIIKLPILRAHDL